MVAPSEPLARLIAELERLPGVGARTAERLAYHLLRVEAAEALRLAEAIKDVKQRLRPCATCFNTAESELCTICAADDRDRTLLCVVESPKDVIAIEKSASFRGLYHVLSGRVSPHEGIGGDRLTIAALVKRLRREDHAPVKEIILATNPDAEGDTTALVVRDALEPLGLPITRIARGLPTGGSIEFANVQILRDAFEGRRSS
jgi:recombination protein RecR